MNMTLDGFISGPNCELDWHFKHWSLEMASALTDELHHAGTILFGSTTYKAMAAYWASIGVDLCSPVEDRAFAAMINSYDKIVFSKSEVLPYWKNALQVREPAMDYVKELKQQYGKPIIIYGSGRLVKDLIKNQLVDEYQLWVHPVAIGKGKLLFEGGSHDMQLVKTERFRSGVVLFYYREGQKA